MNPVVKVHAAMNGIHHAGADVSSGRWRPAPALSAMLARSPCSG
jgi:hypothetical protein